MELVSLKELCREVGVSRRSVQGYEKVGVIRADSKNKYGYLLYSREMVERAKLVKFYRDIGLNNAEIASLFDASESVLLEVLAAKMKLLEEEVKKTEILIEKTRIMITKIAEGDKL